MSLKTILDQKNAHIDKLVAEFEKQMSKLAAGLGKDLMALFNAGRFDQTYIKQLFTEHGFDKLAIGFMDKNNELFKYAKSIGNELGFGFKLGEQSLSLLSRVADQNLARILGTRDVVVNSIIDAGLQAEVGKLPFKQIIVRLNEATGELGRRIGTEAFTGTSIFDRTIRAEQMGAAGVERFVYMGPYDGKTRASCDSVLSDSRQDTGWTMAEIQSSDVDYITGGGFNCRHEWMAFVPDVAPKKEKEE